VRAQRIIEHVVHRGVAGLVPRRSAGSRALGVAVLLVVLLVVLLASTMTLYAARARGADLPRCERFAADSVARAHAVSGSGERVVVLGDSYSAGLGLFSPASSWPSRLAGTVHVAGFSGSGFSPGASECAGVSFADRAPAALRGGADLVVVEGGLNDYDQPLPDVRAGFVRLLRELHGDRVVVVGPALAPSRAAAVPRLDTLLAGVAEAHGIRYIRMSGLDLSYLDDDLHLTPAGHRAFGDYVRDQLAARASH
jgi:acyl-CoA thioesterase-1